MPRLADSHIHLDAVAFDTDRDAMLARARAAGVDTLVVPAVDASSWPRIRALAVPGSGIHAAYGLHPLFIARHRREHLTELDAWLGRERAVAVGEIGLDFHDPATDAARQRKLFLAQLALAVRHDLPVIIHARGALEEIIQTLRRQPPLRGVVHSFSGSPQQAAQLQELGFLLGIGGPVTHARARRLRGIVAGMPIGHLLLETDAPDQPGAAHHGQRNEPAWLPEVLETVAALRGEPAATVAAATRANTRRLFGLD